MQSFFPELEFPLPLSDYSRGKALHVYKRALLEGNVAVIAGIERLATQDDELRQSLELARSPLDGSPPGAPLPGAGPRLSRVEIASPPLDGQTSMQGGMASGGLPSVENREDGQLPGTTTNKNS